MNQKDDPIVIVTVCDNHFAILLAALVKSIEMNHLSGECIELYIIEDSLANSTKSKLLTSVNQQMFRIKWLAMKDVIPLKSDLPLDRSSFPLNVYVRLFIAYFIPADTKKVLYLDVDMIVKKDISVLWQTELGEHVLAAVVDRSGKVSSRWGGISNYKELGIDAESKYFNSGLLLINPIKWREQHITSKVINCINSNRRYANFPDQYGLNVVFANDWLELDSKWNNYSALNEPDPFIIHFIDIKPIYTSYNLNKEYKDQFFFYLQFTAWKDFKPIKQYHRIIRKVYNRLTKRVLQFFRP